MRRLSAAVTCLALVPVLGGLTACSGSDGTPSTTTAAAVAKEAGAAAATADGLGPGKLATFVLEGVLQGVGAQGYLFLSDLLFGSSDVTSDATVEKLDGIQTQLDKINTRLNTIDTDLKSIQGEIAGDALSTKLDTMNGWNNSMRTLYREYFLPVADAAKEVSVAKQNIADAENASCATTTTSTFTSAATSTPTSTCTATGAVPSTLTDALAASNKKLADAKTGFDAAFRQADAYTIGADQHSELFPRDPNVYSVLKLAGRAMESKGYATEMDSQRLNAVYLTLSDQEALTALLILEHDKMFGADAATQQRHRDEYVANHAVEAANLPQAIPAGRIKVGDRMYRADADYDKAARQNLRQIPKPWLPISPEGHQLGSWDATWDLGTPLNVGWDLPTDKQLTVLYDGTKNVSRPDASYTHLGSVFMAADQPDTYTARMWNEKWYWTKDTSASNPMTCTVAQSHDVQRIYTLHHIGYMANDGAIGLQGQPGRIPDNNYLANTDADCDLPLNQLYDNDTYAGSLVLTQPVDGEKDNYMAERSVAVPAPPTPTGTATAGS